MNKPARNRNRARSASSLRSHLVRPVTYSALAMFLVPGVSAAAGFNITGPTTSPQTLAAGESGTVQSAGQLLSVSSPAVTVTGNALSLTNDGLIAGATTAVLINSGANLGSIDNVGKITGQSYAIDAAGSLNTSLTNSGTISVGSTSGTAVYVGGMLTGSIDNSGTISGSGDKAGIQIEGAYTGPTSSGKYVALTGNITNSGSISSYSTALSLDGNFNGTLTNSGTIRSLDSSAVYVGGNWTGQLTNSGRIALNNSGTIDGVYTAVYVSGMVTGDIVNSGTIKGPEDWGVYIGGAYTGPSSTGKDVALNGNITNSGSISAYDTALYLEGDFNGTLTNSGTIRSLYGGVDIYGNWTGTQGVALNNSGTIRAGHDSAVYVDGMVTGDIVNSGTIAAPDSYAIEIVGTTTATNSKRVALNGNITNSGSISSYDTALYLEGDFNGTLTNSGTIRTTYYYGVEVYGNWTGNQGVALNNSGTIDGGSDSAVYVTGMVTGNIVNSGTLRSGDESGIYIGGAYTGPSSTGKYVALKGNITNSGLISAAYPIYLGGSSGGFFKGDLTNSGSIASSYYTAVYVGGMMAGDISNTGTISSPWDYGIEIAGSTTATNNRKVALNGNITNSGSISSYYTALYLGGDFNGTLTNTGTIRGTYYGGVDISGNWTGTQGVALNNSGTIHARYDSAVDVGGMVTGDIVNSGTIVSPDGYAIRIYGTTTATNNKQVALNGNITNSGTISSYSTAVYLDDDFNGTLTNSGTIRSLDGENVYVNGNWTGNQGVALNNSGTMDGGSASAVDVGGMVTGDIVNSGIIRSEDSYGIGIYGTTTATNSKRVALNGSITNSGSISSYYTALYLGGDFNGTLTNTGTISSLYGRNVRVNGNWTGNQGVALNNSGTMDGGSYSAVYVGGMVTGDIVNSGTIRSEDDEGIDIYGTITATNSKRVALNGSITNSGSIKAAYTAIVLDGNVTGSITNTGSIVGVQRGVAVEGDLSGTLTNLGTISNSATGISYVAGVSRYGVNAAVYVGGAYDILNENTIDGANGLGVAIAGNTGTSAQGKSGTLTNVGLINGGVILGAQNDTVQVAGGAITGPVDGGAGTNQVDFAAASYTALPSNSFDHFQQVYFAKGVTTVESAIDSAAAATSAAVLKGATLDLANGGSINVGSGGVLANQGTVVADGGSITGSFGQSSGATLQVPISSTSNYGTLTTSAGADLGKGTLDVALQGQHYTPNGSTYKGVVESSSTTSGAITNVPSTVTDNSAVLSFTDSLGANGSGTSGNSLNLTAHRVATYAQLSGGNPLAAKLDAIGASGSYSASMDHLLGELDALPTGTAVKQAVDSMSPQAVGSSLQGAEMQAEQVGLTIDNRLRGELSLAQNGRTGMSAGDAYLDSGVWVQGFLSYAHQDGGSVLGGYAAHSHGGVIGYDTLVTPSLRLGLAYANGTASVAGRGSASGQSLDLHTDQFSIYGSYVPAPRWYVDGQVAYGFHRNASRRDVSLGGQTALGNFDSHQYSIRAEVGRSFGKRLELTPLARLRYSRLDTQGYTETGAGMYDLRVPSQTSNLGAASLGLRISGHVTDNIVPDASIAYRHAFGDVQQSTTAEIVSTGTTFSTRGLARKSNVGVLQLGAMIYDGNNLTLHLAYELDKASGYTAHTGMLKLRFGF